jgi:hypothetical protein
VEGGGRAVLGHLRALPHGARRLLLLQHVGSRRLLPGANPTTFEFTTRLECL